MHYLEPFYNWRDRYQAEDDPQSPFFQRQYNEFGFDNTVYNYYIHPQWDEFGSETLYTKILFADYKDGYAILEFIGEWNDAIGNDVMLLRRNVIDPLMLEGISKFILIGDNLFNFHGDAADYYEDWFEQLQENNGWGVCLNIRKHIQDEMVEFNLDRFMLLRSPFDDVNWRIDKPEILFSKVERALTLWIDESLVMLDGAQKQ